MVYSLLSRMAVLAFCLIFIPAVSAAKKPNILLIMADDLGFDSVESYGANDYSTPNMTKLAEQGIQFNQAYATPLCTNTRVQIMTGKYQHRNWQGFGLLHPNEKTFGHYMKEAGYKTAMVGKWQLHSYDPTYWPGAELRRAKGMKVEDAGFDEYSLWHVGHTEEKGSRYPDPVIYQNGEFLTNTKDKYGPDIWVDYIVDFMEREHDSEDPFFIYYAMALPHNPFVPTPKSEEWADRDARFVEKLHFYKDMVEYTDYLLGRMVDKLNRLGIREETIIIFYSDNGTRWNIISNVNGRPYQGGKGTPGDQGTRVPMFVSWKGKSPEGIKNDDLIDSTDFLSTMLDAAGVNDIAEREELDGVSFLPIIRGEKEGKRRDWVFVHHETRPGWDKDRFPLIRFARDKKYKLYEDGRLVQPAKDIYEEKPTMPEKDSFTERKVRRKLQNVLDSMKPYTMFDPATMFRPKPEIDLYKKYSFEDWTGCIVMEAETIEYPRDESWVYENLIPGHTGRGYLRSLRDQIEKPEKGIVTYTMNISSPGDWVINVRHRHDHPDTKIQNGFWMKIDDGEWKAYRSAKNSKAAGWEWNIKEDIKGAETPVTVDLDYRMRKIHIAPMYDNFKIARVVAYRPFREKCALNKNSPEVRFHPWFNKYLK